MTAEASQEKIILNIGLHIEDSAIVKDMVSDIMLSDLGLRARFVSVGSEAVAQKMVRNKPWGKYPDLTIVTPSHLTYLSTPESRLTPTMLLTAGNDPAIKELCQREQVVYMQFPLSDNEMKAALTNIFAVPNNQAS